MTSTPGSAAPPSSSKWLAARIAVTAAVMTFLFAAIAWKAWTVQIRDHKRMTALGQAQYLHELELPAPRGPILDTNGVELAVSVEVQSLFANPREVVDAAGSARALARALGLEIEDQLALEARLGSGKRFIWIRRRLSEAETAAVRKLQLPGVGLTPEAQRFYPGGNLAGPVLGVAGLDGQGLEGVELGLDAKLRGERAKVPVLRDGRGALLLHGWEADDAQATQGSTVVLTIDRFIQFAAERAIADAVVSNKAKAGVVLVLDAATSDVLAMASYPTFDPNEPGKHDGARNRPVTDTYEPGSTMKIFSVSAALDAGAVKPSDTLSIDGGRYQVGRKTITDVHPDKNILTISEVVKVSSNVGAAKIARRLGKDALAEHLRRFGFGTPTGIELPGERSGRVKDARSWGDIGLATIAFGYGLTATPLQIAAGVAAIARGGEWLAPHVLRELRAPDGKVIGRPDRASHRVLSAEASAQMMAMLETVMQPGGTGAKIRVPGFRVAGKTGTAHKVDPATRKYAAKRYLSSFVGVVPAQAPRLIVLVMLDEPAGDQHFGGAVAGPVFVRIATEALKYLGVPSTEPIQPEPKDPKDPKAAKAAAAASAAAVEPIETPAIDSDLDADDDLPPAGPGEAIVVIPDFTGMSVAQSVAAARAAGVKIEIEGSGKAIRQFPAAGRAMKSISCRITFDPG